MRPTEFHLFMREILNEFDDALLNEINQAKVFQRATIIQQHLEKFWEGIIARRFNDARFTKDLWDGMQTTIRTDAVTKEEFTHACKAVGVPLGSVDNPSFESVWSKIARSDVLTYTEFTTLVKGENSKFDEFADALTALKLDTDI